MKTWAFLWLLTVLTPLGINQTESDGVKALPNVLLIGDSISIGYTPHVARLLAEKANIIHNPGNAQHTGTGLERIDEWLGDTNWDVIHFNWGLWDLCYRHPNAKTQGNRDKVNGTVTWTLDQYEQNLEQLVLRLKQTNAALIWANTTIVPEGEAGRFVGDDKRYNEVAQRVMERNGIEISDLNKITSEFTPDLFVGPGDVHFTQEGYAVIGAHVAEKISNLLTSRPISK